MEKRGVANSSILLSVAILLFIIGFIVFVFTLMGGEISEATSESYSGAITGEAVANFTDEGTALSVEPLNNLGVSDMVVEGCK